MNNATNAATKLTIADLRAAALALRAIKRGIGQCRIQSVHSWTYVAAVRGLTPAQAEFVRGRVAAGNAKRMAAR